MTSTLSFAPLTLTSPPMYGEHVEALQIGLKSFKYDFGPIDGIYGPLTAGAVELYKADIGYNPVDPTVDLTIYHKLGVTCLTENTEPLIYNNPLAQLVEVVWFNGVKQWIQILEENMNIEPSKTKVAKIFRPVYFVNDQGGAKRLPNTFSIINALPGMPEFSPIWEIHFVIVPLDYQPNSLRSVSDIMSSGYPIIASGNFVN